MQQLDPVYVDLAQSSAELPGTAQAHLGRPHRGRQRPAGEDRARGRHAARAGRQARVLRRHRGSAAPAASRCASWCRTREHMLLPGMYVRALVGSGVRENALLVPQQGDRAATRRATRPRWSSAQDGTVELRPVQGERARSATSGWSSDGLAAGDQRDRRRPAEDPAGRARAGRRTPARAAARRPRRRRRAVSRRRAWPRFFIDRPIFAWVIAIVIMLAGGARDHDAADLAVPDHRAAVDHRSTPATRARRRKTVEDSVDADHRAEA
ncbi:MAG: hypothetical protein MZW92_20725 [Comamonadaceae bacterium]|nr:hypothetical protein [Comamonadaceae bacterium]